MVLERFFLLLSGEHPPLPLAEATALLRASGAEWSTLETATQLLILDAAPSAVRYVATRAAYTRRAYREVLHARNDREDILRKAEGVDFGRYLRAGQTFQVRAARLRGASRHLSTADLERSLGSVILRKVQASMVSLREPNVSFQGLLSEDRFLLGVALEYTPPSFRARSPRRKPFFHPSSLQPKLARCLVNLSEPREGDLIVDPFCGTGSVPLEACLLGFDSIASDAQRRMIEGSRINLNYYGCRSYHLTIADAAHPPFRNLRRVVADPPYGRSASTLGLTVSELTRQFLQGLRFSVAEGGRVVLVVPKTEGLQKEFEASGFRVLGRYNLYVHRSLTRRIFTLERHQ